MHITPEMLGNLVVALVAAYATIILNRTDRNQRELFKRMRKLEIKCAGHHGIEAGELGGDDE